MKIRSYALLIIGTAFLTSCASMPMERPEVVSIRKVDPNNWPSLTIDGQKKRIVDVSINGPAALVATLETSVKQEGWHVDVVSTGGKVMQIGTTGKTLAEVHDLKSRIEHGEFGNLKVDLFIIPDPKPSH